MFSIPVLVAVIAGLFVGAVGCLLYFRLAAGAAKAETAKAMEEAKKAGEAIRREAQLERKEALVQVREEVEASVEKQRNELLRREERVKQREESFDRKLGQIEKKEDSLERAESRVQNTQTQVDKKIEEVDKALVEHRDAIERVSGMNTEQARQSLLERVETEMDQEVAELIQRRLQRAKDEGEQEARKIVLQNIQRYAAQITSENTTALVNLPSDEIKGRIIGREGRNIRAFESATGVDVIVDDTPGVVILSAFDCVRRETARMALEKLVADGRIHPARIEEVVKRAQDEMARIIVENGKKAAVEMGVKVAAPLVEMIGRLRYRTSYGQNILDHSLEVAHIAGLLAADLGLDIKLAKRCGFLHDIGKSIDQEQEGTHPKIGAEAAKRHGEREDVVNAIASHHGDVPMTSMYAVLTQCADAISAARPGARRESLDRYVKRMERLEEIAVAYPAISKAYAIQAGRELRVIAKADQATEAECARLCQQIAKQVEEEMSYPGEIKVTMIRESRFTEYAR